MAKTWVLVAESSRARLFEAERPGGRLHERQTFSNPEARLHERELSSDRPGRTFDSGGEGRHAMEEPTGPKDYAVERFARELRDRLEAGRAANEFEQLVLVAAPAFLGLLREALSDTTRKCVVQEVNKNLVQLGPDELRGHLPEP